MTLKQLFKPEGKMRVAAFMSGTGTNLKKILENQKNANYEIVTIFSDTSDENKCKAKSIASQHGIPYHCNDIQEYYLKRGYKDKKNMKVRESYDQETAKILKKHEIDVVALCGYLSIVTSSIYENYPTLNVHPADLRILGKDGKKLYAGCVKEKCVQKVVESKGKEARSTVHIVTEEIDGGAIIAVSEPVKTKDDVSKTFEEVNAAGRLTYCEVLKKLAKGRYWIDEKENVIIDLAEEKKLIREKMRELRSKISEDDAKNKSATIIRKLTHLSEYNAAKTVMLYASINKEVQTQTAIAHSFSKAKTVVLPTTDTNSEILIPSLLDSPNSTKQGAYGIPEPEKIKPADPKQIDLVVVPGLAFDAEGSRIGYGRGLYDKFLKKTNATKIALAYEIQVTDKIRTHEKDVKMNKIITEKKIVEVGK